LPGVIFLEVGQPCIRVVNYNSALFQRTNEYLAGVRFSPPFLNPVTLTTMRTGFRRPVLTSSDTASVIVALKRPVRRCLGRDRSIPLRFSLKPMSNNRSASSMIRSSKDFIFSFVAVMISCRRPGVPMRMVGSLDLRAERSWATDEVPPIKRLAERTETRSLGRTSRNPFKTLKIWLANSL
jgi:hypothetical protein